MRNFASRLPPALSYEFKIGAIRSPYLPPILVFLCLFVLGSEGSRADSTVYTVQRLLEDCNARPNSTNRSYCLGFVGGITAATSNATAAIDDKNSLYASPRINHYWRNNFALDTSIDSVTNGALVKAFENWANNHPEKWDESASVGVAIAIHELFPDKKNEVADEK
jgi:hypothetical protein